MSHHIHVDLAGIIRKSRNQNFPLHAALLELIDNSLDANAKKVEIIEREGDLWISDDGDGFSNIVESMVVGKSNKNNGIGRYGVGLKDACIRYSDTTRIISRGCEVSAPWLDIIRGNSTGELFPINVEDDGKTHVVLDSFRDRYTRPIKPDAIRRVYAPRLDDGDVVIILNGDALKPLEKPKFTETIDVTMGFKGKMLRLHGGIFQPNDPMRRDWYGYNPFYKGRLIGDGRITTCGVGDEACSNFSFQLDLIDAEETWVLATNKDAVEDLEDVIDACYWEHTRPLLKRAAEQVQQIDLKSVENAINERMSNHGNQTRNRTTGKKGTVKPTQAGPSKKRTNTACSDGRYLESSTKRGARIQFRFENLGDESLGECKCFGKGILVEANLDNDFIERNKMNEDIIYGIVKLIYSIRTEIDKDDLASEEIMARIMDRAGKEMS